MHINLAVSFGSAMVLTVVTSASADGPVTLTDFQLDGVTPLAQYTAAELFQLRIAIDSATDEDPDRARDAVVQEELETDGSGLASGNQSTSLAATTQSASSELTVAPEPAPASTSRNAPATWTGGKYGTSSQRSVAPEPTKWKGGTYGGSSSPRIPAPRPLLASNSRNQPSAWAGGARSKSAVSSSPNLRAVGSASSGEPRLRARPAGGAQRANVTPRLRDMIVNVRSATNQMLRGLPEWESQL